MCNNAPSLSINRTTIVECRGAQTAELLLVTAVLHLPQPDTRAALEHHFISAGRAGGETELSQQTANWCGLREEVQFITVVCFRNWAPALFEFCGLNLSLTCSKKPASTLTQTFSLMAKVYSHDCLILFWLSDYFLLNHTVAQ